LQLARLLRGALLLLTLPLLLITLLLPHLFRHVLLLLLLN
jgi:hypothetical protein